MTKTYIRKATMDDAANLLRWKNDPTMRKYSIASNKKISMKDHMKWLEKHLDEIYIIGDSYGDVRVTDGEVAIKIDPQHRGKGYGLEALYAIARRYTGLIAKIVDGNVASMRLFIKAGYKPFDHKVTKGIGYYLLKR